VAPSISPDHHPRTLLMAAKALFGVWSTEMVVVKLRFFMVCSPSWAAFGLPDLVSLLCKTGVVAKTHRCAAIFFHSVGIDKVGHGFPIARSH